MTLPSSVIPTLRAQWADRFIDSVTFTRKTGRGTFNDTTLQYDSATTSTPYTGAALIRPASGPQYDIYGEQQETGMTLVVKLPHDATGIQVEDLGTVDTCAYDSALVGATVRVVGIVEDSYNTHRDIIVRRDLAGGFVDAG